VWGVGFRAYKRVGLRSLDQGPAVLLEYSPLSPGVGFGVWGLGFWALGLWFGVWGLGNRGRGFWCGGCDLRFRVSAFWLSDSFLVSGF